MDESWPNNGQTQSLGPLLPHSHHPKSPFIMESKVNLLAVKCHGLFSLVTCDLDNILSV